MDRRTPAQVDADVAMIKAHMPQTYKAIQAKAAEMKSGTFALVRRGLAGEPNCFYAFEGGRVVGTKFDLVDITDEVARLMVQFGGRHLCMWAVPTCSRESGGADGAH